MELERPFLVKRSFFARIIFFGKVEFFWRYRYKTREIVYKYIREEPIYDGEKEETDDSHRLYESVHGRYD